MPRTRRSLHPAGAPTPSVIVAVIAPDASDAVSTLAPARRNIHDATCATPYASVMVLAGSTRLPGSDCGCAEVAKRTVTPGSGLPNLSRAVKKTGSGIGVKTRLFEYVKLDGTSAVRAPGRNVTPTPAAGRPATLATSE